ncbi:MAG: hypothetical protein IJR06_01665 [Paludibacteraceae bacterium]|nr:hypothetical protein [Paludibacteraceae bacterium]
MKKYIITCFAIAVTLFAMAEGTKVWMYSHSGNHLCMDIADFDSLSFIDPVTPEPPSPYPTVEGTAGKYTIAFQVPVSECGYENGIFFYGAFEYWNPSNPDAPKAEAIVQEGYENWYKITFEAEDGEAIGKICPAHIDGSHSWYTQAASFDLVDGASLIEEHAPGPQISFGVETLGGVVYAKVAEWAEDPCEIPN